MGSSEVGASAAAAEASSVRVASVSGAAGAGAAGIARALLGGSPRGDLSKAPPLLGRRLRLGGLSSAVATAADLRNILSVPNNFAVCCTCFLNTLVYEHVNIFGLSKLASATPVETFLECLLARETTRRTGVKTPKTLCDNCPAKPYFQPPSQTLKAYILPTAVDRTSRT